MLGIKNWKTSLPGIAAIFTALATILQTVGSGHSVDPTQWGILFVSVASVLNGIGNMQAKDHDVTGGTVGQTDEAKIRVMAPEVITEASIPSRESLEDRSPGLPLKRPIG
jgi:hypothetical protein